MVNEKMHQNLKKEMQDLCSWLKLDFLDSCLEETFLGKEWLGESSYLGIDELSERPPIDFYTEENVEKRWRKRLNENEIIMIEYLFTSILFTSLVILEIRRMILKILSQHFINFFYNAN